MESSNAVERHYERSESGRVLVERVEEALRAFGSGPLTALDLAGFDQFHVRGLAATRELGDMLGIAKQDLVLDAGAGIGGPARFVAEQYGCRVIGVDLTPAFVEIARLLTERSGLADRVEFQVGNLLQLGFPDAAFDVVYTQHAVMNISDRDRAYRELRRVLKPGGRFGFYDVLAGDGAPPVRFPVPWAEGAETSALLTEEDTRRAYAAAGLELIEWKDLTEEARAWSDRLASAPSPAAGPLPGLGVLMGPRFEEMLANVGRNLREGAIRLVMGACKASG